MVSSHVKSYIQRQKVSVRSMKKKIIKGSKALNNLIKDTSFTLKYLLASTWHYVTLCNLYLLIRGNLRKQQILAECQSLPQKKKEHDIISKPNNIQTQIL